MGPPCGSLHPQLVSAEYMEDELQSTEHPSPSYRGIHNIPNNIVIILGLEPAGHQRHVHSPRGCGVRVCDGC